MIGAYFLSFLIVIYSFKSYINSETLLIIIFLVSTIPMVPAQLVRGMEMLLALMKI